MVAETYDAAMVRVFADEGGYTNDPQDPGGATNWGITIADARMYWKSNATPLDVKTMPKSVASDIYRAHYARPVRYDDLPAGFDYSVFDAGINSGIGRAIPWGGKALGNGAVTIDKVVVAAAAVNDKVALIQRYWGIRVSFLHGLRTWSHFGAGWSRRCANGEAAAVRMWLSIGMKLPSAEVAQKNKIEAQKASKAATNATAKTVATGASPAATAHPYFDITHLSLGGKVLLAMFGAVVLLGIFIFIRQIIFNKQRAAAYAAA